MKAIKEGRRKIEDYFSFFFLLPSSFGH